MENHGFNLAFWTGIPISFLIGIAAGYYSCVFYEKHKKNKLSNSQYFNIISQTTTLIHVEAQLKKNTETTQALFKAANSSFTN